MKIKNVFILIVLSIFLFSCQGAKDALQGKKRSNTNEEFLVKKKLPLTEPPDMNKLPLPEQEGEQLEQSSEEPEIKKILKIQTSEIENNNSSSSNSSLEQSIIEKINN